MSRISSVVARTAACAALITLASIAPASAVSLKTYEQQVISSTNAYRASEGKARVRLQSCVDRWANGQAKWMAERATLAHREGRLRKILRSCKLTGVSENIAWNYSTGREAVAAWADSPGHAKNMRASEMRYIGVGVARASDGDIYVSQVFGTRR